jgi:hypothetical protein
MQPESDGCLRFHRSRRLDGSIESVSVCKRNGKSSLFFHPSWTEPPEAALNSLEVGDPERYSVNLNPIERETWRRIRQGDSIACIANDDGVARSAIYSRIRGNRKGQGGMTAKNFWVLLWWALRQQLRQPKQ